MKTHNLIQGSTEWHAHRATHFNASDAPAMMGCSPYETRTQLIHRLKTGIGREVDPVLQRRFDDGHRFEALARPLAEQIIGEDLYPVTGTKGELSASFDGLTMAEDIGFEHKSLNNELREALPAQGLNEGVTLPLLYRVQMEQQCMVAECERELFMASKWEGEPGNETLVEERHCWYESNTKLADDIEAGWRQLAVDLAAYVPAEPAAPKPTGNARESLPALIIEAKGEITDSNLDAYKVQALGVIASIPTKLETDQQFADAKEDAKFCRNVKEAVDQAAQVILGRMGSVDAAIKAIDLENAVETEEKRRKQKMLTDGADALRAHVVSLNTRIGKPLMPVIPADFAGAAKNKRTIESLQNAIDTELARAKIEANRVADLIDANLKTLAAAEPATLFPDTAQLVLKAADDLAAVISSRIAAHKAAEEAKAKPVEAPAAAPIAAPAPSVTQIAPAASRQVVVEQQDLISAFLASRTWGRGEEAKARAVLVEFEKFKAAQPLRKAA
jgi:putative phage-type endonuclease